MAPWAFLKLGCIFLVQSQKIFSQFFFILLCFVKKFGKVFFSFQFVLSLITAGDFSNFRENEGLEKNRNRKKRQKSLLKAFFVVFEEH